MSFWETQHIRQYFTVIQTFGSRTEQLNSVLPNLPAGARGGLIVFTSVYIITLYLRLHTATLSEVAWIITDTSFTVDYFCARRRTLGDLSASYINLPEAHLKIWYVQPLRWTLLWHSAGRPNTSHHSMSNVVVVRNQAPSFVSYLHERGSSIKKS